MQTKLFRSGDVCAWAQITTKTLHAWVQKGKVKALPTHGRHLRFEAAEVHKLLTFLGLPIPEAVAGAIRGSPLTDEALAADAASCANDLLDQHSDVDDEEAALEALRASHVVQAWHIAVKAYAAGRRAGVAK